MSAGSGVRSKATVKVALAVGFADLEPRYDETEYLQFGQAIRDGATPSLWRAPGYQWFVAAGLAIGGGKALGARLLQVVLSVAASLLAYRIGREHWGERAGLAAVPFQAFGLKEDSGWFRLSVGAVSLDEIEEVFPRVRALLDDLS